MQNDRFIRALHRQPVDRTPVWIMRQAGRYLPEYRAKRLAAGSFLKLCKTPELACEVTLQPLARFDLDAAILFSDILTIPDAMGLELSFEEGEGPVLRNHLKTEADILRLSVPEPEIGTGYVMSAIRLIKHELQNKIPLIGFAGSPWTLASYMLEGKSSQTFSQIKALRYQHPAVLHVLLNKLSQAVGAYLKAQIAAGVNAVMIFDTWGGMLTTPDYATFSLQYMKQIIQILQSAPESANTPIILFTKTGNLWLQDIAQSGCHAIGVDWTINIGKARDLVQNKVAIQGNLDPATLYGSHEIIRQQVQQVLNDYGHYPGHIFNLGHGIYPDIPPENVAVMIHAVQEFSLEMRREKKF